jgi:serpin B
MGSRAFAIGTVLLLAAGVAACGGNEPLGSSPTPVDTTETSAPDSGSLNGVAEEPTTSTSSPPATVDDPDAAADSALPLRFGSLTERAVDGGADGRNATAAVTGMNEFAIDLYRSVLAGEDGNVIVGPYSVTFAMSMVYAGARGDTAAEMADVLHATELEPEAWHEGINAYDLTLDARTVGSSTEWSSANKVWTKPGLALRDDYLDVLTGAYGSPLAELDFGNDPDGARELINEWIAERTNELIPELWPPGSLSGQTAMVLVNAVAMDAPWEFPFDPAMTSNAPFTKADGSVVQVPTMRYDEYLPSLWREDLQAVELPYGDGALSMVVIVPNDLEAFEAELSTAALDEIVGAIEDGGIHLTMPKWSARTHITLNETLAGLGMPTAFSGAADFSRMIDGGGLWLDQVEHEAFVDVDEQGTRAAAATGGEMVESHGPTITVDRPFLYMIRDRGAGTILFIGRVTDPTVTP